MAPQTPLEYVWSLNGKRRHLSPSQLACVGQLIFEELEKPKAKQRQKQRKGNQPGATVENLPQLEEGKARDKAGEAVGVSGKMISDAAAIKAKAPDVFEKVLAGDLSIHKAKTELRKQEEQKHIEELRQREVEPPTGLYDVIVIDPPWPMEKIEREVRPNQVAFDYPVLEEDELSALDIPAADDCHLFLWTTQKFLRMALRLLDRWQFSYVCTFVWHKPGGFQPVGLPQFNCEFAVYARRGTPKFADLKAFSTCFEAARGKHSEKPEEFYSLLRRVTAGQRLDMFNRRTIDGFHGWGNEA
jgi:N6-adenosine-specific RNA methylase IME4